MASIDPEFMKTYKQLIVSGYDRNFKDGMALEKETTDRWNAGVTAEEVEQRRLAVMERGRALKD